MTTDDTRESRADHSVGGGNDSHADVNPPHGTGQEHSQELRQHHLSPVEATAPVHEIQITTTLTDAQREVFWAGIVASMDAARGVACRIVRRQDVDDVVHTGALRFIESLEGPEASAFPATEGELRTLFLKIVRRYAIDCVRDSKRPSLQTHSNWGTESQPVVRGRNVPDRALESVFARHEGHKYDARAATSRLKPDDIEELSGILDRHLDRLSEAQREILVQSFYMEEKRADIAARRGITLCTYDNYRQAALKALRKSLAAEARASRVGDRSVWFDRIEEMIKLRADRVRDRPSSKKDKASSVEGKAGSSRGEGDNSEGEGVNVEGERDHWAGERREVEGKPRVVRGEAGAVRAEGCKVRGERANAAHERDGNQHEGDAHEPVADRSSSARNRDERRRPRIVRRSRQGGTRPWHHSSGKPRSTT